MSSKGWIYCMSNPSMPGLLKIGQTKSCPTLRAKELFKTGVPLPFHVEMAKKVQDYEKREKTIHKLLENLSHRINPKREFFRVELEHVKLIFDLMDGEDFKDELEDSPLQEVLTDGQLIRSGEITGTWNSSTRRLNWNGGFTSLETFLERMKPNKVEIQIDTDWIDISNFS